MVDIDSLNLIFKHALKPVKIGLFTKKESEVQFECLYKNSDLIPHKVNLYSCLPLLRVVLRNEQLLNEDVYYDFFQLSEMIFCYILEWDEQTQTFLLFDLENLELFEEELFLNELQKNKNNLRRILNLSVSGQSQQPSLDSIAQLFKVPFSQGHIQRQGSTITNLELHAISLNKIVVNSREKTLDEKNEIFKIFLKDKDYHLHAQLLERQYFEDSKNYQYVYSLKFKNIKYFRNWFNLISALHTVSERRPNLLLSFDH